MIKLKNTIIENLSTFSWKNERRKLERNMHKTRTFLTFSKKEGGTITATTSAKPANAMELNPSKNR